MTILQEIMGWSRSLPAWQSDAITRLMTADALSNDDLDDLFALLKAEHGIPDPKGRIPNRLRADQIPAPATPNTQIKLLAMKNLRHVNRIAENQRLSFGPDGLTAIYGDNGSGKSGYSRVLKRACRARDQAEPIHPNAFLAPVQAGQAQAAFEVEVNGAPQEALWINGKPAPAILSSLAIFDARCARSYLDDEGDFAYVPYGLDILERLAGACRNIKVLIETERAIFTADTVAFADLVGDTVVAKIIAGLSHKTKPEQIEVLATLTPEQAATHSELGRSLKEVNPKEKAMQLRLRASRILKIVRSATQKLAIVDDVAVTALRGLADSYYAAEMAAALAARKFKEDGGLLPGTGDDIWKNLFEAARKFSLVAYPDFRFPNLGPESQCPLCQQPLAQGAERLLRFEEFIQQEAAKVAQDRRKAYIDGSKTFGEQNTSLGMDEELYAEIEELDQPLASDIRAFEAELGARHAAIKAAVDSRDWNAILPPSVCPAARLQSLADKLTQEAETLEKLTDEKVRAAMRTQFNELDARIRLAQVKSAVLATIGCYDRQNKLDACLSGVKTNAISLKAAELTEKVISRELEEALNREFKSLGTNDLQVQLKSRADRGKAFHKLKLNLPQAKTPAEILSEGEQRAIAIGSFLAEVSIGGGSDGIIFDDPVSSLDHERRERVAKRFAQEAAKRQVIVFTHDIYFLCLLVEEARKAGVPVLKQSLTRRPEGFGVADPDLPFEGMNTKARVGYLRNRQQEIKKIHQSGDKPEYRRLTDEFYRQLRLAWERAIEEVLLRNVVLRFRKGIESQRLAEVAVEDQDYSTVDRWMSECSNRVHDPALLGGTGNPNPDELLADINALDEWRKELDQRANEVRKRRKSPA